jgi:hypothetical protein
MQPAGGYSPAPYGSPYGQELGQPGAGGMVPAGDGTNGPKGQVRKGTQVVLYSVLSCGLYAAYWMFLTFQEMSAFLKRDEPNFLKVMGLSIVTCNVYGLYWFATRFGALVAEIQQRAGVPNPQNLGWMYIIPYYNLMLATDELNKAWQTPG